jgi:anti-anti-sigma regulatory factor
MNKSEIIQLSSLFNEKINGRSAVKLLFQKIEHNRYVVFDFSNIIFISRAAAHEMAILLEEYQKKGFYISLRNISPHVNQMLDTVSESRKVDFKKATFVKRLQFSSEREMKNYLLSF